MQLSLGGMPLFRIYSHRPAAISILWATSHRVDHTCDRLVPCKWEMFERGDLVANKYFLDFLPQITNVPAYTIARRKPLRMVQNSRNS